MSQFFEGERSSRRPSCQVLGCFEPASVYVVVKESEADSCKSIVIPVLESETRDDRELNAFKLVLHLCSRHDYDFKYLLRSNELEIARRRHLTLREVQ